MKLAITGLLLAASSAFAGASLPFCGGCLPPAPDPASLWAVDYETGGLWRVSNNTFQNYTVLPQMISLRTPAHIRLNFGDGELTVRARFTFLAEAIVEGPESAYFGFSASPSVEYWFSKGGPICLYASIGGGVGWIDSTDIPGGQGQDTTLNWFATAGVRHYFRPAFSMNAGLMFQHWSNGGATDPNPGLDALGPVVGVSWHF